jgi:3-phenylpropionate/cinnamic acid dioxygenase small subunit
MRLILLSVLVVLLQSPQGPAVVDREEPDLVVVKFNWETIRANSDLIHSALDPGPSMNEPISIKQPPKANEPDEVRNRRDRLERRADMIAGEQNARQSGAQRQNQYLLHIEVRNVGTNVIKSIVWEYQPSSEATNYDLRQYVCSMKAKPKESKTFELLSPYNPVKVVQADAKTQAKNGKAVINRIEYADGSVWKRKGWSVLIPPEMTEKIGNGKCVAF